MSLGYYLDVTYVARLSTGITTTAPCPIASYLSPPRAHLRPERSTPDAVRAPCVIGIPGRRDPRCLHDCGTGLAVHACSVSAPRREHSGLRWRERWSVRRRERRGVRRRQRRGLGRG